MSALLKLVNDFLFFKIEIVSAWSSPVFLFSLILHHPLSLITLQAHVLSFSLQSAKIFFASGYLHVLLSLPGILFLPTFHLATPSHSSDSNIIATSLEKLPMLNRFSSREVIPSPHPLCFTEY